MITYGKKYAGRMQFIIIAFLTVCILILLPATKVSASTVQDNTSTVQDNTPAAQDNTTTGSNNAEGGNINGSLGPLEFSLNTDKDGGSLSATLQILMVLTVITLAPSILIMVTSFTRILIVLHFVRSAIGTQTTPPNQILVGLALFLTFFIMSPVFTKINNDAIKPLSEGKITQEEAFEAGAAPIRTFMLGQTQIKDINLFLDIAKLPRNTKQEDVPLTVVIPAFIISELRTAFIIGFLIYIPFIVIDMVVASTLMSMGMMMLPPTMISMPFKILLFIMADGWNLIVGEVVKTFY